MTRWNDHASLSQPDLDLWAPYIGLLYFYSFIYLHNKTGQYKYTEKRMTSKKQIVQLC